MLFVSRKEKDAAWTAGFYLIFEKLTNSSKPLHLEKWDLKLLPFKQFEPLKDEGNSLKLPHAHISFVGEQAISCTHEVRCGMVFFFKGSLLTVTYLFSFLLDLSHLVKPESGKEKKKKNERRKLLPECHLRVSCLEYTL